MWSWVLVLMGCSIIGTLHTLSPKLRSLLKYIMNVFLSNFEYWIEKKLTSTLELGFPSIFFFSFLKSRSKSYTYSISGAIYIHKYG